MQIPRSEAKIPLGTDAFPNVVVLGLHHRIASLKAMLGDFSPSLSATGSSAGDLLAVQVGVGSPRGRSDPRPQVDRPASVRSGWVDWERLDEDGSVEMAQKASSRTGSGRR
jgi:hypothetical protein